MINYSLKVGLVEECLFLSSQYQCEPQASTDKYAVILRLSSVMFLVWWVSVSVRVAPWHIRITVYVVEWLPLLQSVAVSQSLSVRLSVSACSVAV